MFKYSVFEYFKFNVIISNLFKCSLNIFKHDYIFTPIFFDIKHFYH